MAGLFAGYERRPLALAVSGGADSMALMHMAARWAKRPDVQAGWAETWRQAFANPANYSTPLTDWTGLVKPAWLAKVETGGDLKRIGCTPHVVVLTVDHGLRDASREEARLVCEEASRLGLACVCLTWEGPKPASAIQELARAARRDLMCDVLRAEAGLLDEIARSTGFGCVSNLRRAVVTAHHQEDQAETFLMRLARGSGLEGLGGIRNIDGIDCRATLERPQSFQVTILRPLLDVSKARLVATLEAYGARWVDDPSNEDERFERVRVRKILAQFGAVGLTADKIALSARRLREAEHDLRALMDSDEFLSHRPAFSHGGLMSEFDIDVRNPYFVGDYVAMRTLRQMLRAHGGSAREVALAQLEKLLIVCASAGRPSGVTLGGCKIEFLGEHGQRLRVYREGAGEGLPTIPIEPGQTVDWDGRRFEVSAGEDAPNGAVVRALGMQGWADVKKAVAHLKDLKWPAAAAATLPVVSVGGEIVAYPGLVSVLERLGDVPEAVGADWAAFEGKNNRQFSASFGHVPW